MFNDGFDPIACQRYVESLVRLDEVERALLVLDNVPAYYRDHCPENLAKLRADILASLCTTHAYMTAELDPNIDVEIADKWVKHTLRGMLIAEEVKRYNANGITPNIVDMGPGEYNLPIGLDRMGLEFTYQAVGVDARLSRLAGDFIAKLSGKPRGPNVFVALEVIEHLPSPQDIVVEALRHCGSMPDRIHLSTPAYTFDVSEKDWRKPCGLPHLRAYTPLEFGKVAQKLFPGYHWEFYPSELSSLRAVRAGTIDSGLLLGGTK